MSLIRVAGAKLGTGEFDVRIGLEWSGPQALLILENPRFGIVDVDASTPIVRFAPVTATVIADADEDEFWQVHDLARDCINQGGISEVSFVVPPDRDI